MEKCSVCVDSSFRKQSGKRNGENPLLFCNPHSLESFCTMYEEDIRPSLKQSTWLTKENIIQKKILPYLGKRKVSEITAKDATIDFLLDERIRELVGEELRRFTLVRTGKLVERVKKYNPHSNTMDEHHTLWPIPQTIIDSNTGAEFPQNPGY